MLLLIPIAFISGILTVFSPCVLPILPIILASGIDGNTKRIKGTIFGLVFSFTITSLLLATIVRVLGIPADTVRLFAIALLVVFGISLVFPSLWQTVQITIEKYWHFQPKKREDGFVGGFLTGVSLGIVWTPCIGPVLAAVATLAAVSSFSFSTVLIALAYAIGTSIPLYYIAKGGSNFSRKLDFVKKENHKIRQIFGLIVLASALFIWTGADRALQAWTLSNLPVSWVQLPATFEKQLNMDSQLQILQKKKTVNKANSGEVAVKNVDLQNDFIGAKIQKEDLLQGCFGKDCIPSIDNPIFEAAIQADKWLQPNDRVFAINYGGILKAYPQRIMNWHEIVNDEINGAPVAVTFCPLCGSALAFERTVDGIITEFGVSGMLHNSDLVMYDRYEGNLWQQITGEAIVGFAARRNEKLKQVPIVTTTWKEWKKKHPETEVLSLDTGFTRDYNNYPYGTYEENEELLFGVKELDKSLHIKAVVYGLEINGKSKAYPENIFEETSVLTDTIGDLPVRLERDDSGKITVTNLETGEQIIPIRLFWFAWAAFHPDTELYTL